MLIDRFNSLGLSASTEALPITTGSRADYLSLKCHHYRAGNPATISRALVVRDACLTPGDRFLHRHAQARAVAVLIESLPSLSCRLREQALNGRYGYLPPKPRADLLNQELRCISRVIVDPRYRGMGLAVRLVRHALKNATTRYTEALAVMGRVSPFFTRAGMTAYERPPGEVEQRALAALRHAQIEPLDLASPRKVQRKIKALGSPQRAWLIRELSRWYRTAGGRGAKRQPELADIIPAAQQRLLAKPIYYLHENKHVPAHPASTAR